MYFKSLLFFSYFFLRTFAQIIPSERAFNWSQCGLKDTTTNNFNQIDLSNYGLNTSGLISNDSLLSSIINTTSSGSTVGVVLNFPSGTFI